MLSEPRRRNHGTNQAGLPPAYPQASAGRRNQKVRDSKLSEELDGLMTSLQIRHISQLKGSQKRKNVTKKAFKEDLVDMQD